MSIKTSLLSELAQESASTKRLLASVAAEHWGWKPHEKSMTLGALSKHVAELHGWVPSILHDEVFNLQTDYTPLEVETTAELIAALDRFTAEAKAVIEAMDDEKWSTLWQLKSGEHVLAEMPRVAAMRYMINNHVYHHRGQLTVYLRLLDIPVPGMYGPTADDRS